MTNKTQASDYSDADLIGWALGDLHDRLLDSCTADRSGLGPVVADALAERCKPIALAAVNAPRQIQQLAALIDTLAMIPAPDFYTPGDVTAEKVAVAWRDKNRILSGQQPSETNATINVLRDALEAACAYVELHTGNGCKQQPPAWALKANGEFDADEIAKTARTALAGKSDPPAVFLAHWDVKRETGSEAFATRAAAVDAILGWANDYGWPVDEYEHDGDEDLSDDETAERATAQARAELDKAGELSSVSGSCHYHIEQTTLQG